jgi:hypothetical protein
MSFGWWSPASAPILTGEQGAAYCGGMDQKISSPARVANGSLSTGRPVARTGRASSRNAADPAVSARATANFAVSDAGTKPRRVARPDVSRT